MLWSPLGVRASVLVTQRACGRCLTTWPFEQPACLFRVPSDRSNAAQQAVAQRERSRYVISASGAQSSSARSGVVRMHNAMQTSNWESKYRRRHGVWRQRWIRPAGAGMLRAGSDGRWRRQTWILKVTCATWIRVPVRFAGTTHNQRPRPSNVRLPALLAHEHARTPRVLLARTTIQPASSGRRPAGGLWRWAPAPREGKEGEAQRKLRRRTAHGRGVPRRICCPAGVQRRRLAVPRPRPKEGPRVFPPGV
jgi:hypothetical protein